MMNRISPAEWHGWHLDPATPALTFETEEFNRYEIDLHRMLDASDILSWIMQLHHKGWGSEVVTGLVTAVDDVLAPQQRICAFRLGPDHAEDTPYTPETLRARVDEFVAGWPARNAARFADASPSGPAGASVTDRDWQKAVEVEPRLAALEAEALAAARHLKTVNAFNPHRVYRDLKPYLAALVGPKRGSVPSSANNQPEAHEERWAGAVAGSFSAQPEHDTWLRRSNVFDHCCAHLNDALSEL